MNIDEGEPGTFKDLVLLEADPHRFLEGMLVAARAVGVQCIYVYLRDEHHACRALLETELEKLRADPRFAGQRGAGPGQLQGWSGSARLIGALLRFNGKPCGRSSGTRTRRQARTQGPVHHPDPSHNPPT